LSKKKKEKKKEKRKKKRKKGKKRKIWGSKCREKMALHIPKKWVNLLDK